MRNFTTPEQNNKSSNWTNDHGEMRRDGKRFEGKWFIATIWKYIREERLEKKHKGSYWWRTQEVNKRWSRIERFGGGVIAT